MIDSLVEAAPVLSELKGLGLTVAIDEATAIRIKGELLIVEGLLCQGVYQDSGNPDAALAAAYQAIATEIVHADTPKDVIDTVIPTVVLNFVSKRQWRVCYFDTEDMKIRLYGPITEWQGRQLRMQADDSWQTKRHQQAFPNRAAWLRQRLKERGWDHNDPIRYNGPDRKTVRKMLQGSSVRPDVLEKLALALSLKLSRIRPEDIPSD